MVVEETVGGWADLKGFVVGAGGKVGEGDWARGEEGGHEGGRGGGGGGPEGKREG